MRYCVFTAIDVATAWYLEVSRSELEHGRIRAFFAGLHPSAQSLQEERWRFFHSTIGVSVVYLWEVPPLTHKFADTRRTRTYLERARHSSWARTLSCWSASASTSSGG